ncbi:MAG: hypothetical protein F6J93_24740 [Oscillatoria sp. SIO1A7]|nr:hypothetical protein [Oscillatoria sp. SIO1A7]
MLSPLHPLDTPQKFIQQALPTPPTLPTLPHLCPMPNFILSGVVGVARPPGRRGPMPNFILSLS